MAPSGSPVRLFSRLAFLLGVTLSALMLQTRPALAQQSPNEKILFTAVDNAEQELINHIRAETVRVDLSAWYLTDRLISQALVDKWKSGVPVRVIGDRAAIFEADTTWHTLTEFSYLASQGVPLRLRVNPTWFPEIDHWKASIFAGQGTGGNGLVSFGSANYTPLELVQASPDIYKDETVYFTDDPQIVGAVKMKFDQIWNDMTPEPDSKIVNPPFMMNWYSACLTEPMCDPSQYTNIPVDTSRQPDAPDVPLPPDISWGQGQVELLNRMVKQIDAETDPQTGHVEMVEYRLSAFDLTDALIRRKNAGINVRVIVEPEQYDTKSWPEYELTRYNVDRMWVAGVQLKQRKHDGLTHMKILITTPYALNASSNYTVNWQRDINHFVSVATKPWIYNPILQRFNFMWNDTTGFEPFKPEPPDPAEPVLPRNNDTGVSTSPTLTWNRAAWAVSYDVYFAAQGAPFVKVGNVPAVMSDAPPLTYSWTPPSALQPGTTYIWRIVSRTVATDVDPTLIANSDFQAFTTSGSTAPPAAPNSPTPASGATNVATSVSLTWTAAGAATYDVHFGTTNPPPTVSSAQTSASYTPATLTGNTTYFWQIVAQNSSGATAGPVWSFTTGTTSGALPAPWISQDVGSPGLAGSASFNAGTFTVRGAGADIWAQTDAFQYVSQPLSADGQLTARVVSVQNTNQFAKAGIMFRTSLAANSAHVILDVKPNGEVEFMTRSMTGGDTTWLGGSTPGFPAWVRLVRSGSTVTGSVSTDGASWTTIASATLAGAANLGMLVLSHNTGALNTAIFDNVLATTGSGGGTAPGSPASPSPTSGATGVSTSPTLTWSSSGATSYDVKFGASNPPSQVTTGQATASYTPGSLANGTTYFWQIIAKNSAGTTPGAIWSFTTATAGPSLPGTPGSPSPSSGATGVGTSPTLTWSSSGATSYDVKFGTSNPPPQVATGQAAASYAPAPLANSTTYFWQIVAKNSAGQTAGPIWSFTTSAPASTGNIVLYTTDILSGRHGTLWTTQNDATAAGGVKLITADTGQAWIDQPLAAPDSYIDITFNADANTPYTIWLRLQATANNKYNDSVWVQFSDARFNGQAIYPINTTSGLMVNLADSVDASSLNVWGWQNGAYWLAQHPTITFPTTGQHTMRIQLREDGVQLDQVVLSPTNYLNAAPGHDGGDSTIVPKQ